MVLWGVRCWRRVRASIRLHREIFMKTLLFGGVPLISLLVPLVAEKYLQFVRDAHVSDDLIAGESYEAARELRGPPARPFARRRLRKNRGGSSAKPHMIPSIAACFGGRNRK
jgi:hypothetical protein